MKQEEVKKPILVSLNKDQELVKQIKAQVEDAKLKPDSEEEAIVDLFWEQFGIFTYPPKRDIQSIFPYTKGQRDRQAVWQYLAKEQISLEFAGHLLQKKELPVSKKMRDTLTDILRRKYLKLIKEKKNV